jgi:hypothetical protein
MAIKAVLREELANSQRMQVGYERALVALPKGSLVRRIIKGHSYYYLVFREGDKVRSVYKGILPKEEVVKYREITERRARYRRLLSKVRKQVRFLKGVLRGQESI